MSTARKDFDDFSPPVLRVLILEDNPRDAKLTASALESGGYTVQSEVTDSKEVFQELLEKVDFDVILADFNLRNWTAMDALQILNRSGKDIPVIVVTGTIGDEGAVECLKHGAADYVLKDRPVRLPIAVDRALEERRLREERKRAGEALRESEGRFRMLFAGNPLPMWVYDLETLHFMEVNDAAVAHYGYSREEFLSLRITDIRPAEDTHLLRENLAQGRQALEDSGPWRHKLKDARIILTQITSHVLPWNGRSSALVVAQDITERARTELALRESEERYRTLFESNLAGVLSVTPDGEILECNQAMADMLGFQSLREVRNLRVLDFYYSHEDRASFLAKLEAEGRLTNHELHWRRKDGSPIWLIANVTLVTQAPSGRRIIGGTLVDITERKLAEAENARLAAIVNSSDDAIFSLTREGLIATWNAAAERMYGYSAEEIKGKPINVLFPEGRQSVLAANREKLYGGEALVHYEFEHLRKDGTRLQVSLTLSPIKDAAGVVTGVSTISRDITERKRAADALQNEKAFTESIIESLPDMFYVMNESGRYLRWNKNAEKVLGYPREEVAALEALAFVAEEDRALTASKIQEAFAKGSTTTEAHLLAKDGRKIPYLLTATRAVIGDKVYLVGIGVDISERKQVEAEKARLVTAIEQSAEGVVITNTAGDIEYVNPAFTQITGYSRDEVLGQNPRILKSGKQDLVFYQQLWATILKGEIWHGELINRRKDGKFYTEELNIAPVHSAGGEISHFIATKQDVTERKRLEEQFRQAQKIEAVGRLAGGVAHDFNNLLTIINGYSEMVLDRLDANDPARGQLEEIRKAGDRAASLTRQLLAFSRQQVLAPRVLDLNTLVTDVEKMLRRLIGEDIDLGIVRDPGLGQVKADPGQIEQILMNLAVNARDAMPEGGKLVIETANVELDEAYADRHGVVPSGRYVLLAVNDTGIGMDAETQAHIFEPFFTTKEQGKGTGLGLATVYGIVKQSGGFVWVYSELGRGTTFRIYLPRVDEAGGSVPASEAGGQAVGGAETILLVEDEEAVRALAARILQDLGYRVLESDSPEDALRIGEQHQDPIHLLLTDVVMPRISGRKIAESLAFLRPALKVLYMSGYTDDAVFRNGVLEPGATFLQKPFTPAALARKVREVLDAGREHLS